MRFPGFDGEWKRLPISRISDILCGYAFDGNSIVEYETPNKLLRGVNITEGVIRHSNDVDRFISGEINTKLDKYILQKGDLVIGMDGSKVGKNSAIIKEADSGSYLVQRVCRLRSDYTTTSILFHQINNIKFHKYVDNVKTSSAIPHISQADISNYIISLSSNSEENSKIAKLLNSIDERIATQNKIIDNLQSLIKGLIQQLSWEGLANGRWHKVMLSEVLNERNELNREYYPVHSVSVTAGVVNQVEYLGRSFAAKDTAHYHVVKYGDIVYTKSPTGNQPYGIVKQSHSQSPAAVSPLYGVYEPVSFEIGNVLHYYFLNPLNTNNYLSPLIQKGAKNTINISNQRFLENRVPLPIENNEIQSVSRMLSAIYKKIVLENETLTILIKQKQYLLKMLFI